MIDPVIRAALRRSYDSAAAIIADVETVMGRCIGICERCGAALFENDQAIFWDANRVQCSRGANIPGSPSYDPTEPPTYPDRPCFEAETMRQEIHHA